MPHIRINYTRKSDGKPAMITGYDESGYSWFICTTEITQKRFVILESAERWMKRLGYEKTKERR